MHHSGADAEGFAVFEDTRARRQLPADALNDIGAHRATPEALPLAPRPREAGFNTLDDYCPLELGKDAQNLIHRLSGWRVVRIGFRRCSAEFQFPSPSLKAVTVQTGIVLSSAFVVSRPNCSSIPAN
jgi:hypothetical protein